MSKAPAGRPAIRRVRHALAPLVLAGVAVLLGGCGGGLYVGTDGVGGSLIYDGGSDGDHLTSPDRAPTVALAADAASVTPGQPVTLLAAATDDYGVDRVQFLLRDARGDTDLGSVTARPYTLTLEVPTTTSSVMVFVARAYDAMNHVSQDAVLTLPVVQ